MTWSGIGKAAASSAIWPATSFGTPSTTETAFRCTTELALVFASAPRKAQEALMLSFFGQPLRDPDLQQLMGGMMTYQGSLYLPGLSFHRHVIDKLDIEGKDVARDLPVIIVGQICFYEIASISLCKLTVARSRKSRPPILLDYIIL